MALPHVLIKINMSFEYVHMFIFIYLGKDFIAISLLNKNLRAYSEKVYSLDILIHTCQQFTFVFRLEQSITLMFN